MSTEDDFKRVRAQLRHRTGFRHALWALERIETELKARRLVGAQMANACFNTAQPEWVVRAEDRAACAGLVREWDAITEQERPLSQHGANTGETQSTEGKAGK